MIKVQALPRLQVNIITLTLAAAQPTDAHVSDIRSASAGSPAKQSCEGKGHVTWNRIKVTRVRIKQPCEYLLELKCKVVLAATCVRDPDLHYSWESLGSPSGTREHGKPELPVLELEFKKRLQALGVWKRQLSRTSLQYGWLHMNTQQQPRETENLDQGWIHKDIESFVSSVHPSQISFRRSANTSAKALCTFVHNFE